MFTAHIREIDKNNQMEQSVEMHCKETAELAKTYAINFSMSSTAYLQGLLHDIGKLTDDFNTYIHGKSKFRRGDLDHSFAGAKYICEIADCYNDEKLYDVSRLIARTIISHHGLHDWIDENGDDYFTKRISKQERYEEICKHMTALYDIQDVYRLLEAAAKEYALVSERLQSISKNREHLAFYLGLLERLMQSVLIDADRTNTADFISNCNTEKHFEMLQLWECMHIRIIEKLDEFSKFKNPISLQRKNISDCCANFANHKVRTCQLIIPTGSGKTLASLRFAIEYCRNYQMQKIIYVAPFMSILEQNSDVICSIAGDENFLEHHSNILQSIDDEQELSDYELHTEKWDSPVIATTMVQFFQTLFSGNSASVRRMHRFSRSVIIIDEVQSIPLKCIHLFNMAINFLTNCCGCCVVLCSATQPAFQQSDYPLILDEHSSIIKDNVQDFEVFRRTEMISKLSEKHTYDSAAKFCYEKYTEHKSLLVIVNTKASAAEIYKKIKEKNATVDSNEKAVIIHLSTNMCPAHRREKISQMQQLLKDRKNIICVTTQLIEAGVDISFGCVIRSLAGMDSVAQASGRCNRNGEKNGICPVYLIYIQEENLGNLSALKSAQSVSRRTVATCSKKNMDLLSTDVMASFFKKYHRENEHELSYSVTDITKTTLLKLLACNVERRKLNTCTGLFCGQAFRTAGSLFKVIDEKTENILVPYQEEAKTLISQLETAISPYEIMRLMRKAQAYTVGIYPYIKETLVKADALEQLKCGVLALRDGFYHDELGVCIPESETNILIY